MTYRFDDVEIDAAGFRVTKAGAPVRLEPKALETLLFLVTRAGRLVTKGEIQEAVWKDTFVTENALTRLVAQIRKALGDDAHDARYIETVPTRGYRFVARLELGSNGGPLEVAPAPAAAARPAPRWHPGRRTALGGITGVALLLLGIALRGGWAPPLINSGSPRGSLSRGVERQISTSADLNIFPCFSPDGSSVAFSTYRKGSMEIVVRASAAGAREVAVTGDGAQNVEPAFSPDGRLIAYHSLVRGGIWLVPALGGVARQLTPFGSHPAWSPDGSLIALQSQAWVGSGEGAWSAGEGSTLWLVSSSGGEPRPLTSIEKVGPGGQGAPTWSPDGQLISFLAGMRAFVVRRDGSGLQQTSRRLWVSGIAWERSGRSQVWTGSLAGNWFVWRVPVSPETGALTGPPEILGSGGETASAWAQPTLSADGKTIAYVTFRTRYELLAQQVAPDGRPRESRGRSSPASPAARFRWGFRPTAGASRSARYGRASGERSGSPISLRGSRGSWPSCPTSPGAVTGFRTGAGSATWLPALGGRASGASTSTAARRASTGPSRTTSRGSRCCRPTAARSCRTEPAGERSTCG